MEDGGARSRFQGTVLRVDEVRIPGLDVAVESVGRWVIGDSELCDMLWLRWCECLALQCEGCIRIPGASAMNWGAIY